MIRSSEIGLKLAMSPWGPISPHGVILRINAVINEGGYDVEQVLPGIPSMSAKLISLNSEKILQPDESNQKMTDKIERDDRHTMVQKAQRVENINKLETAGRIFP